jgi:hypothetical protein
VGPTKFRQEHDLLTGRGRLTLASAVVQQNNGSGEFGSALSLLSEASE